MTYDQLTVLDAIVSEGTFRAAAKKLFKSQSAISHALKKLEHEIGFDLLSREEYRPQLTPAGKVFYRQVTRVLHQMQELNGTAKLLNSKQEAEVFLAVTATYPLKPLLTLIREISETYPDTHIRLSRETMGGTVERLLSQDADIVIASMDGVPTEHVEAMPFSVINIIPVAHPEYGPATIKKMKTNKDMQSYVQVVVADSSTHTNPQSRDLIPEALRWTVSDFHAKKEIILSKMGWGGIPEHMIKNELMSGELVKLELENFPIRHSQLYKIRRRNLDIGIVAQSIWQKL
jgi:DNA-binding transcriptional LysR family regulator